MQIPFDSSTLTARRLITAAASAAVVLGASAVYAEVHDFKDEDVLTAKQLNDSFADVNAALAAANAANAALDARLKSLEAVAAEKPVFAVHTGEASATQGTTVNVPGLVEVPVTLATDGYLDIDALLGVDNAKAPEMFAACHLLVRLDNQAVDTGANLVGVASPFATPWFGQVSSMSRIPAKKGTHYVTIQLHADPNWGGTCRLFGASRLRVAPTHY